jgi:hypothetical protein
MCWTEALAASTKFLKSLTGEEGGRGLGFSRSDFSLRAAAAAAAAAVAHRRVGEERMEGTSRADGRNPNQLRTFSCTGNPLNRAHGSARWAQGGTVVLAAVYGPKPGTRKGENPERASIEVVWKPKTGQIGTRSALPLPLPLPLPLEFTSHAAVARLALLCGPLPTDQVATMSLRWQVVCRKAREGV